MGFGLIARPVPFPGRLCPPSRSGFWRPAVTGQPVSYRARLLPREAACWRACRWMGCKETPHITSAYGPSGWAMGKTGRSGLRNVVGRSLRPSDVLLDSGTWVLRWPAQVGVPHEPQARVSTAADC